MRPAGRELRRIRWDTWSGMVYSDVTAYFIILATAVTYIPHPDRAKLWRLSV
jgi:hypothetical protein